MGQKGSVRRQIFRTFQTILERREGLLIMLECVEPFFPVLGGEAQRGHGRHGMVQLPQSAP